MHGWLNWWSHHHHQRGRILIQLFHSLPLGCPTMVPLSCSVRAWMRLLLNSVSRSELSPIALVHVTPPRISWLRSWPCYSASLSGTIPHHNQHIVPRFQGVQQAGLPIQSTFPRFKESLSSSSEPLLSAGLDVVSDNHSADHTNGGLLLNPCFLSLCSRSPDSTVFVASTASTWSSSSTWYSSCSGFVLTTGIIWIELDQRLGPSFHWWPPI
jgi:hypothetical protein